MQTQSEAINELMAAMNQAQLVMSPAKKDKENPFFKSHYADLSTVWEALLPFREAGIVITQSPMEGPAGHVTLETQLTHAASGQWIRSRLVMPLAKQDPQGAGSAITYARRYALGAMTGLITEEDDDGNRASQPTGKTFAEKFPRPMPSPDEIVPPGGSQAPSERVPWTVPNTPSNQKYKHQGKPIVGMTLAQLTDLHLAGFLREYEEKINGNPTSPFNQEWQETVFAIEEEIALRRDGLVLR